MMKKQEPPHISVDYFEDLTGDINTRGTVGSDRTVGDRIQRLRREKGVSLEELARATGFPANQLAAFEQGDARPQLGAVMKLSRALDTVFGSLLSGEGDRQAVIVRKDNRIPFERSTTSGRKTLYSYLSLASAVRGRHMEPLIVHLEKSDTRELSVHEGEEFIYVLEGRVRLTLNKEAHELAPGDSVYYHSGLPHLITALDEKAVILAVLYE